MTLQPIEVDDLAEHEATIANGLQTFKEVGYALADIRDRRLYRGDFGTFEDYCRERWNLSRAYAYQVIEAAEVAREMSAMADIQSERQARAIKPVLRDHGPEVAAEVLREAADDDGRITARSITEATARVIEPEVITAEEFVETYQADVDPDLDIDALIPAQSRFERAFWQHLRSGQELVKDLDYPHHFNEQMTRMLLDLIEALHNKRDAIASPGLRVVTGGK